MWAPCFDVEVVGTTGSGDATIAGFLSALLRDASPEEAMTMAVAVGACNVEARRCVERRAIVGRHDAAHCTGLGALAGDDRRARLDLGYAIRFVET